MKTAEKVKFPRANAISVAREVASCLKPVCERILVAGSLRRGKAEVGDVELLYIPKVEWCRDPGDFFSSVQINMADNAIASMEINGVLAKRKNVNGSVMFGPKNKIMVHCRTGIPVDLFSTSESCWFNYLVCRTGPAESNTQIAIIAQRIGWRWQPYSNGFYRDGKIYEITSEEDVFRFVGLPKPPKRTEIEI